MATSIRIRLQEIGGRVPAAPPPWAAGDQTGGQFWYFINQFGEQWIARRFGDEVVFSGQDLRWEEVRVTAAEARTALRASALLGRRVLLLKDTILEGEEALWGASVLRAAFPGSGPLAVTEEASLLL